MTKAHTYTSARCDPADELPLEVLRYLDGAGLVSKSQAVQLSTVDETGWPRASLLSAGDMLAQRGGSSGSSFSRGPRPRATSCATAA